MLSAYAPGTYQLANVVAAVVRKRVDEALAPACRRGHGNGYVASRGQGVRRCTSENIHVDTNRRDEGSEGATTPSTSSVAMRCTNAPARPVVVERRQIVRVVGGDARRFVVGNEGQHLW